MRDSLVEITEWSNGGLAARLFRCRVDNKDFEYPDMLKFVPLALDLTALPPLDTAANVQAYGTKIHAELSSHPAIKAELTQIFHAASRTLLKFFINLPVGNDSAGKQCANLRRSNFLRLTTSARSAGLPR